MPTPKLSHVSNSFFFFNRFWIKISRFVFLYFFVFIEFSGTLAQQCCDQVGHIWRRTTNVRDCTHRSALTDLGICISIEATGFKDRQRGCSSQFHTLEANLTRQDAPHVADVDLSRPDGPEDGSRSAVPTQHAAEHFDRTGPTWEDRDHRGPSRRSHLLRRKGTDAPGMSLAS